METYICWELYLANERNREPKASTLLSFRLQSIDALFLMLFMLYFSKSKKT